MGAFKNEKNGTWYVQFRYTDWQGLRQQKLKRGFATKREAQEWERAFLTEKKADVTMPFKTFTELYEKDVRPKLQWQKTVSLSLAKRRILNVTKWNTGSVRTRTAITVQVLPFFILFITDIFARQAKRSLLSLQLMFGVFQRTAKQTKSLQKLVLRLLLILLRKSVCRQPLRSLVLMKISTLKKSHTHVALYRVLTKR